MRHRWLHNFINWATVILVAAMLPVSCIVHCHGTGGVEEPSLSFYVCHPFSTVDNNVPQQMQAHEAVLRATHEVAILVAVALTGIVLQSTIATHAITFRRWYPQTPTHPPQYVH